VREEVEFRHLERLASIDALDDWNDMPRADILLRRQMILVGAGHDRERDLLADAASQAPTARSNVSGQPGPGGRRTDERIVAAERLMRHVGHRDESLLVMWPRSVPSVRPG
jgi:hypothetical protein